MRKKFLVVVFIAFLAVFIRSGYAVFQHYSEAGKQDGQYDDLLEQVQAAKNSSPGEVNSVLPEYAELFEQNSDLVGWIKIEGTDINYPVVQSKGEAEFYLKHSFDKTPSDYGCPFVEQKCDVEEPSDNLIIYGHHLRSKKMFSHLTRFKRRSFWQEHKRFSFDTLYEKQTYEIVAAFKTVVYTDDPSMFRYYEFVDAETPQAFEEYISRSKAMSDYDTGVTATYGDKLLTLSTCEYSNKNGRFVVVAKRVA